MISAVLLAVLVALSQMSGLMLSHPASAIPAWTSASSGVTDELDAVYYYNGRWVIGGASGRVGYSDDNGASWSTATPFASAWHGVTCHNGLWVMVGSAGAIMTSPDGANWTQRASGTPKNLRAVASNGTTVVAVGEGGAITTSYDGISWSPQTMGVGAVNIQSVTYGGGVYVAVGSAGTIYRSGSGTLWLTSTLGVLENLLDVSYMAGEYAGGTYVAVSDIGRIRVSSDGAVWSAVLDGGYGSLYGVATGAGRFVAVGDSGTVISSADLGTWTPEITPGSSDFRRIGYGGGYFVAVGLGGAIETRPGLSNNCSLGDLTISPASLDQWFVSDTTSYTATVPYACSVIDVTATVLDPTATLKVNGWSVESGNPEPLALSVGANSVVIVVTAQDGATKKAYTISVTRVAACTDSNLDRLTISTGYLTQVFAPETTSYAAIVPHGTSFWGITATAAESRATLTINGRTATSGAPETVLISATAPTPVPVVVTAEDGTHTTTYLVTVWPAPAFTGAPANYSQQRSVGAGLLPLQASTVAGTGLTYSVTDGSLPDGITLNADGTFSGTATTIGITSATITVLNDHGGTDTTTLVVGVQAAPAFTASVANSAQLVSVTSGLAPLQATAASLESLTFSVADGALPAGISINGDGTFSGAATTAGSTTATIQACDTHGGVATTTLVVTVQEVPAFTASSANTVQTVSVGSGPAALQTTKATGETLTFSLTGGVLPAGVTLNANGTFSGTATTVGATTATIQASDTHGGHATTTLSVTVQTAPAFTGAGTNTAQTVGTGGGLIALEATAATGETITYTVIDGALPANITLRADGTFSGAATTVGATSATIRATDTHGGSATTALAATVQRGPAFTAGPANTNQAVAPGQGLTTLVATVGDNPELTFSLVSGAPPPGITLSSDGTFTGTASAVGTYNAMIEVVDGQRGRAVTALRVVVAVPSTPESDETSPQPPPVVVDIGGTEQAGGTATTEVIDGTTITTVSINGDAISDALAGADSGTTVSIPVSGSQDTVTWQLPGDTMGNMQELDTTLVLSTPGVSLTLPVTQLDLAGLADELGQGADLSNASISITIAAPSPDTARIAEDAADRGHFRIVVQPIEFAITCTRGDRSTELSRFSGYVERTVAIPDGIDPARVTTAVVLNADGTFSHVPTQIVVVDGHYYAKINSLTNSVYTLIYNQTMFSDVAGHWSREAANDMGSRLIVSGYADGTFRPDKPITRAEFAAIVVKALGLRLPVRTSPFSDVTSDRWYYQPVRLAYQFGIVTGYDDGTFRPDSLITREEAMAMIYRAMSVVKLASAQGPLPVFKDSDSISGWARSAVEQSVINGLASGSDGYLRPTANVTRAQTATMLRRLLQAANLIN